MFKKIVLLAFFGLILIPSIKADDTEHQIYVGGLRVEIESPNLVEPNKYFEVEISISVHVLPLNLSVKSITGEITGAGIFWAETLVSNLTVDSEWSYNKTVSVKPTAAQPIDLLVIIDMHDVQRDNDIYSATDLNIAHAKQEGPNIYQNLTYILTVTTVVLLTTTIYTMRHKVLGTKKRQERC